MKPVKRAGLSACILLALAGSAAARRAGPGGRLPDDLMVTLTPKTAPQSRAIERLGIDLRFSALTVPAGQPIARLALIADNVDTVATVVTDFVVTDRIGQIAVRWRDVDLPVEDARDSETGGPTREWYAARNVVGPVTIRYSVPAMATLPPRGPTGPIELRNEDGAVSGAGNTFLILPPGDRRYRVALGWDLAQLPAGARGLSSLGEGRVVSPSMSGAELRMSYIMAGAIGGWPSPGGGNGFFSAWQGDPPFDAAELMQWTSRLHGRYRAFFRQTARTPYGVFLRHNPVNAGGGTGFFRSFVTTYGAGKGSDVGELRITLAHEMFHTFQPFITDPAGKESSWFGEGLAVFYEAQLPYRFRMISTRGYLADINFSASRYYSSIMAKVPNAAVAGGFWKDTRIRTLTYDRGMLYFATVDEQVRRASHGKQSLDDLMLAMLDRQTARGRLTNADWEEMVARLLGAAGVTRFRQFMAGDLQLPSHGAFGRCFTRTTRQVRRYDTGFDPAVLAEPRRIVRGLVAGSAADKAGLRNGDEIVKPVPQDQIQGEQGVTLTLAVHRGGREFPVTYLPRGEMVDVYQWIPVAPAPKGCVVD